MNDRTFEAMAEALRIKSIREMSRDDSDIVNDCVKFCLELSHSNPETLHEIAHELVHELLRIVENDLEEALRSH